MSRITKFSVALLAVVALLVVTSTAQASFVLSIDDGVSAATIVIDEAGIGVPSDDGNLSTVADSFAGPGTVQFSGSVGVFSVVVSVGVSKPLLGPPPEIDLLNIAVSGGSGTLTISLTDTGFDSINAGFGYSAFRTQIGGTTTGIVDVNSYVDDGNTEFATTEEMGDLTFSAGAFSAEVFERSGPMDLMDPKFSMTIVTKITHTIGMSVTSFDINLHEVPEPTTFGLGLVALGGLFFMSSRRRKR